MFKFSKKASKKFKKGETRVQYNQGSTNGLMIEGKYIPEELLSLIFCYIDHKTLLACQLVCKQWHFLVQDFVWHKKAELSLSQTIPIDKNAPWTVYYFICAKTPFDKNLIKNHSGEMGVDTHWTVIASAGNGWSVENPPAGVPALPNDPVFEGKDHCFVTSHYTNRSADMDSFSCRKFQVVDLVKEGFSEYLLDYLQPRIKISEWYSCRWDCPAAYACNFQLIGEKKGKKEKILDNHRVSRFLLHDSHNKWIKVEYVFKNYGKGLRKIKFIHCGQDLRFWAGYFGSKMAGACIKVENPLLNNNTKSISSK